MPSSGRLFVLLAVGSSLGASAQAQPAAARQVATPEAERLRIAEGVPRALARCEELMRLERPIPGCPPYIYRNWDERVRR